MARGAYQVLALTGAYLTGPSRAMLQQLAQKVRAAVYSAVEQFVGLDVIEVNVEINDVHVPGLNDAKTTAEKSARQPAP